MKHRFDEDSEERFSPDSYDPGLVEKACSGDAEAFGLLASRLRPRLMGLACRIIGRRVDAEDVVQDALLKAFRGVGSLRDREAFSVWLMRITVREGFSYHRRTLRTAGKFETFDETRHARLPSPGDTSGQATPEDLVCVGEQRRFIGSRLSRQARLLSPLLLRVLEGLTYREIAELLGLNVNTAKSRVHRARKELQRRLKSVASLPVEGR